jgi:hypothetical protein
MPWSSKILSANLVQEFFYFRAQPFPLAGHLRGGWRQFGQPIKNGKEYEIEKEQPIIHDVVSLRTKGWSCRRIHEKLIREGLVLSQNMIGNIWTRHLDGH